MTVKYRSRKHCVLLYPDCAEHLVILEKIKTTYEHAGILHDKDVDESGNVKKPHYHIVVSFKNAMWNTAISKELGLPLNLIQQCRNEESALAYLIHFLEENKHHYALDEVFGTSSLKKALKAVTEKETLSEGDKVIELLEMIENADKHIDLMSFSKMCASAGRWDIFRRSASIFLKVIEEKNKKRGIE